MKCNYKNKFFLFLLIVFVVDTTVGGRSSGRGSSRGSSRGRGSSGSSGSGGGFFSRVFGGGSKSSSSSSGSSPNSGSSSGSNYNSGSSSNTGSHYNSGSYPKQTYSTGSHNTNPNYGWKTNTGGNNYNSGYGHYYNSPSSSTNWGGKSYSNPYSNPSYHQPQNTFGNFHPVSSGVAPSYHFARSTSYIPIYIPSHHTYYHNHQYTNNGQSTSTTNNNNNNPPPPPSEPVVYKEDSLSSSYGETSTTPAMIVGFNNMIVYGVYADEKHYVITVNEDLDEDVFNIPEKFLRQEDSNLFDVVTLKPPTTTTTTTTEPSTTYEPSLSIFTHFDLTDLGLDENQSKDYDQSKEEPETYDWNRKNQNELTANVTTEIHKSNDEQQTSGANVDDVLDLYFGDIILR